MKIILCIKQIPDTSDIKWTENNTMVREGVESILNPYDEFSTETAIRLKESCPGSTITVITMGPPQAKDALKKCLAMGCDDAVILSDKKFAAADTWATSITVATGIKKFIGEDFDIIVCGQYALDGDTGQTGPSIAEHLNLPQITFCKNVEYNADEHKVIAKRQIEYGTQKVEMKLPGLICMIKTEYEPRMPNIKGVMRANKTEIPMYNFEDVGLTVNEVGLKGSPTYVGKSYRLPARDQGEMIAGDAKTASGSLVNKLLDEKILVV